MISFPLEGGPALSLRKHVSPHLMLLLVASFVLLAFWSFIVPIFEAPDEPHHWQFARHLNQNLWLPIYDRDFVEANQPPLYYLMLAPFASDTPHPPSATYTDPQMGMVLLQPPKFYSNSVDDFRKYWPIRVCRLLTALMSVGTVFFAYLTGCTLTGNQGTGILAGWMTALLPQFTFRGMNISNDALVALTSAAALYCIVVIVIKGYTTRRAILCGIAMGLAVSSKLNAIFLPGIFVLAMLLDPSVPFAGRLRRMWVAALAGLILSPFLIRNQVVYGDPLASAQILVAVPDLVHKKSITSPYFLTTFPEATLKSFVGVFGGMNVWLPVGFYRLFTWIAAFGLTGLIWGLIRKIERWRVILPIALVPLMTYMMVIHINLTFNQPQGRFLFPALTAIAVLLAIGFQSLPGWRRGATLLLVAMLAFVNLVIAGTIVVPAYWTITGQPLERVDVFPREAPQKSPVQLRNGERFVQEFRCKHNNLSRVEILMPNWGRRAPSGTVKLSLIEKSDQSKQTAVSMVTASDISDNAYINFKFDPVKNSKDRTYLIVLEPESIPSGYLIGVWLNSEDVYVEGRAVLTTGATANDSVFRTYYSPAP
jgi:hypothetical protein